MVTFIIKLRYAKTVDALLKKYNLLMTSIQNRMFIGPQGPPVPTSAQGGVPIVQQ